MTGESFNNLYVLRSALFQMLILILWASFTGPNWEIFVISMKY